MMRKISIAANILGIISCIGMFYAYSSLISALFTIIFGSNIGAVAIIGGDGTESVFSMFQPLFFAAFCSIIFLANLFVLIRKAGY